MAVYVKNAEISMLLPFFAVAVYVSETAVYMNTAYTAKNTAYTAIR